MPDCDVPFVVDQRTMPRPWARHFCAWLSNPKLRFTTDPPGVL